MEWWISLSPVTWPIYVMYFIIVMSNKFLYRKFLVVRQQVNLFALFGNLDPVFTNVSWYLNPLKGSISVHGTEAKVRNERVALSHPMWSSFIPWLFHCFYLPIWTEFTSISTNLLNMHRTWDCSLDRTLIIINLMHSKEISKFNFKDQCTC